MHKIILLFLALLIPACVFSQSAKSDTLFGEAVLITADSIQKLPVNGKLVGKWVLVSTKAKNDQDGNMGQWGVQTIEFHKDRTLTITPGPRFEKKIYWYYIESEQRMVLFSTGEGNKSMHRIKFPVLKMKEDLLITTEWVNIKSNGKYNLKLTFLKIDTE